MDFVIFSDSKIMTGMWEMVVDMPKISVTAVFFLIISSYITFNKYFPVLCNGNPVKITVLLYPNFRITG